MDEIDVDIQSEKAKAVKVKSAIHLNNEVLVSVNHLLHLKSLSMETKRNSSASADEVYFKEFEDINSSQMNSEYEVLDISERMKYYLGVGDDQFINSEIKNTSDLIFNLSTPRGNNVSKEVRENLRKYTLEEPAKLSDLNCKLTKTNDYQRNKLEKDENVQCSGSETEDPILKTNLHTITNDLAGSGVNKHLQGKVDNFRVLNAKTGSDFKVASNQRSHLSKEDEGKPKDKILMGGPLSAFASAVTAVCKEEPEFDNREHLEEVHHAIEKNLPIGYNLGIKYGQRSVKVQSASVEEPLANKSDKNEIKPMNIIREVGEEYEIIIENVISPSEFYVYVKDDNLDIFRELIAKLQKISLPKKKTGATGLASKKECHHRLKDSNVLFYSKCYGIWCRAKIVNWFFNYNDEYVKIFLLDYGEYNYVSVNDLIAMPEHLKRYPAFVRRCHLYGILPSVKSENAKAITWTPNSIDAMLYLTDAAKEVKIRVAPQDNFHPASSLPVILWLIDIKNVCVNEALVNHRHAVYCSYFDSTVMFGVKDKSVNEDLRLGAWDPMKEDFEAYENSYDLNINDPATYIYGYVGNDYKRICKHFAKSGRCFKGNTCKKEHKKLDPLGYTMDQEEVYKSAFNSLVIPPPESVVPAEVTCVLAINKFCCILEGQDDFSGENLQSLRRFINQSRNIQEMKKLLIPPSIGQIVLVKSTENLTWYRGKILESLPENDTFTVLFVDYGNIVTVPLTQIRAIEARYLHLPFQALQCYIFGINETPKKPSEEGMTYLDQRVSNKSIRIEIVSRLPGEDPAVLVHLFDKNGQNIGEDLLAKNYCVPKEELIINSDFGLIPG